MREELVPPGPIVKWAGGKKQLLDRYSSFVPQTFHGYHEPFVGGGALFFYLYNKNRIGKAFLNDTNSDLINLYSCIQQDVAGLIKELGMYEANKLNKQYYYEVRNLDRDREAYARLTSVQRAARTLYLNKTCFNGLFRVNRKGQFNVPFGNYKRPRVLDAARLSAASRALRHAALTCLDFESALAAAPGDFIYLDPPYHPASATASFTSYTRNSFSYQEQQRLARTFREFDQKGCHLMLSNSCAEPIIELYKGYHMEKLMARRAINCHGDRRGPVPEIVVTNYKL